MKANPWLLPGVALLVTGGWIAYGKQSAAALEHEITVLTERIRQVRAAGGEEARADGMAELSRKQKDEKIDWKDIAGKMAGMRGGGGMGDMRTMMRLQRLLLEMSAEELGAQLDEIATLDLDDLAKKQLQGMILGSLAEKDPKMVIERFGSEAADENSPWRWSVQMALGKWAEKEPAAAAAWLDKQIAAGKFESKSLDGKNQERVRFEGVLVAQLLKTDPAAAAARVAGLPEDQREDFFKQGFFFQVTPESESSYAKLVRESLPADKVGGVLADTAGNLAQQGGYERVDGFLATAKATDEEKKSIVSQVMERKLSSHGGSKLKVDEIEKARAWGITQSPGVVDKATGEALANTLWRGGDFKTASELALQYHESSGNDEVLASFLKSSQVRHTSIDQALPLIEQIKDPGLREEIRALPQFKK
ncbi:MAG: hypothetical protein Q8Q59_13920 [Luteolibacter sp.]|jgi:hypothetical protein|nr:hypothetical protein [Luteolibacter sp.]